MNRFDQQELRRRQVQPARAIRYAPMSGSGFKLLEVSAVAALGSAVLVLFAPAATARQSAAAKACKGHRVRATHELIVVTRRSKSYSNDFTNYYVCARTHGRPLRFATAGGGDDEYGPERTVTPLQLAGPFAAVIETSGLTSKAACTKYGKDPCPSAPETLEVADVRHRRVVRTSLAPIGNKLLALSGTGAAAWSPAPDKLWAARLGGPAQAIALQGPIVPASVRFSAADVLSWKDTSGAMHTAALS